MLNGAPVLVSGNFASVPVVGSQMSGHGVGGVAGGGRPPLHGKRGGHRAKRGKAKEHNGRSQRAWASPQGAVAFKGSEGHGTGSGSWSWRSGKMGGSRPRRWSLTGESRTYAGLSGQKRKTVEETPRHGCLSCPRAPENTNSFLIGNPLMNPLMTPMATPLVEAGLDSWCGNAAGYHFLDDQTASLANNLSFDGSNVGLLRRDDNGVTLPAADSSDSEDELSGGFHLYDECDMGGDLPPDVQGLIKKQASHISELQRHIISLQAENDRLKKDKVTMAISLSPGQQQREVMADH